MKKLLIYPWTALAALLVFSSCMKKFNVEPDPFAVGKQIYSWAQGQQTCAMDGANIAFRLNILLNEIKQQYPDVDLYTIDNDLLKDVQYVYNPGPNQKICSLSALLFGSGNKNDLDNSSSSYPSATITASSGIYTITYPSYYMNRQDAWREGSVQINTHGALLNELDDETCWEVSNVQDKKMALVVYSYGEEADRISIKYGNYAIYHPAEETYWVEATSFASQFDSQKLWYDTFPPEWYIDVTIKTINVPADWECYQLMSNPDVKLEMTGGGGGSSMYLVSDGYQIEPVQDLAFQIHADDPLIYRPGSGCSWSNASEGSVDASLSSDVATVKRTPNDTCTPVVTIRYKGEDGIWQ